MKKTFNLPQSKQFPKFWCCAPNISPLYSPKTLRCAHFLLMKAPVSEKMVQYLPPEYNWTCKTAVQEINKVAPPDSQIFAINLSKKNNCVQASEWIQNGVNYEEFRIIWDNPKNQIQKLFELANKPSNSRPVVFALYSGTGFNKTVFACAATVCNEAFNKLPEVISTLLALHPPGLLNQKAITAFNTFFKQPLPIYINVNTPKWYVPLSNLNKKNPTMPKITFPGIQEIGATSGNRNDFMNVKKILTECDVQYATHCKSSQVHLIWSENKMKMLEDERHRVTFQPEGDDVILIMFDKFSGFMLDSNGEVWNVPVKTRSDVPLVLIGVLQRRNDGNFTFFVTDLLRCGDFFFKDESFDTRLSYIWTYIIGGLTSKETQPTMQFVMRPCALIKDSLKVLHFIPRQYFQCSGICFVPENKPPGQSILLPYGECLVPFQAVAISANQLVLYAHDDQSDDYIPITIAKVDPNQIYLDGNTVYANFNVNTNSWDIKKYSREPRTTSCSIPLGIFNFITKDALHPQEILRIVQDRCKHQDNAAFD